MKASLEALRQAAKAIAPHMPPTPQYRWPVLTQALNNMGGAGVVGTAKKMDVVVKHENHTPIGAFKVRGGLNYVKLLLERESGSNKTAAVEGLISATRGNHGQSLAFACRAAGLPCTIVVPYGNAIEKNESIKVLGANLIEHGADFDAARHYCQELVEQAQGGLHFVPSFSPELIAGVGTYAMELFTAEPDLDTVYVPIGMGSGVCGLISARDALGLSTKIVGVVSDKADGVKLSVQAGHVIATPHPPDTFADGMAVREGHPDALKLISEGADRIVTVTDDEIAEAIRLYFRATHNVAEGAGASPLAALMQERMLNTAHLDGKSVGVILCGQNIDSSKLAQVLAGHTPDP
jgi:threonine dehydratase